ncbi:RNA family protein [Cyclospora cayetanensis]|uniref:RNA family protein n=1 Tax=Cyclospora cayetanensis TaxID=88456 RepID=A0A1D3CW58_9EIME|nr:RNA family protein [Cyclospora cayetanensis]
MATPQGIPPSLTKEASPTEADSAESEESAARLPRRKLLHALERIHAALGASPGTRQAFVASVRVWISEAKDAAAEAGSVHAFSALREIGCEAVELLLADQGQWKVLLQPAECGDPDRTEQLRSPLHPRLLCGCFLVLEGLLEGSEAAVGDLPLDLRAADAVAAAVETLRVLPAAADFATRGQQFSKCARTKHLGRASRKGMEAQHKESAQRRSQQQRLPLDLSAARFPTIAAYADVEEARALHGAAVSLLVRLVASSSLSRCSAGEDGITSTWLLCELKRRLSETVREQQQQQGDSLLLSKQAVASAEAPSTADTAQTLKGLNFATLVALAREFCSKATQTANEEELGLFAQETAPLLQDILTVATLQPLASTARRYLLPAVLSLMAFEGASAFLFAALHRLLAGLTPSPPAPATNQTAGSSGGTCSEKGCRLWLNRSSVSLDVFAMLRKTVPPPRCGEAFHLALQYHSLFLSPEGLPPPKSLSAAEQRFVRQVRSHPVSRDASSPAETLLPPSGEAQSERECAWGPSDIRWRWLFWGLACPVIGSVRSNARQLMQQLLAVQTAHEEPLQKRMQGWGDAAEPYSCPPASEKRPCITADDQRLGWSSFMQLLEALDDFSQHLIQQQQQTLRGLCAIAAKAAVSQTCGRQARPPPLSVQPLWVEAVLLRAFAHDNALLSRSFLLSFMKLCCDGLGAPPQCHQGKAQGPPSLLLCVSLDFVLGALVPHIAVPSFFCRSNDCRQAEATIREASDWCGSLRGTYSRSNELEETGEAEQEPALLQLLHAAFPSLDDFGYAVQQLVQRSLTTKGGTQEEAKEGQCQRLREHHAAFMQARLLAVVSAVVPHHEASSAVAASCFASEVYQNEKRLLLLAALALEGVVLKLPTPQSLASASAYLDETCMAVYSLFTGLSRALLAASPPADTQNVLFWPQAAGTYGGMWSSMQQHICALRCLMCLCPSKGLVEGFEALPEMSLEAAFAPVSSGRRISSPAALLLMAAVAALGKWGIRHEAQTTGAHLLLVATAVAVIGAFIGASQSANLLDSPEVSEGPLLQGLWVCANGLIGSSMNRKALAALKHAALPHAELRPADVGANAEALSSSAWISPEICPLPEGLKSWATWLDVVAWFYRSKGDALATLFAAGPLAVAASAANAPLERPQHLKLLPRCTPADGARAYVARVASCQLAHRALMPPSGCPAGAGTAAELPEELEAKAANAAPEATADPLGVALLLMQEIGRSYVHETPGLLQAVASFAIPTVAQRVVGSHQESQNSRKLTKDTATAAHAVLASFVTDCRRLIQDRSEMAMPPSLVGRLCCVVLHPLMIEAEWKLAGVILSSREAAPPSVASSQSDELPNDNTPVPDGLYFVFEFARDLLAEGAASLALSRAVVLPLLSSLFRAGNAASQGIPAGFSLPPMYIRLLVSILLHREFVLLDGDGGACPAEPFEEDTFSASPCSTTPLKTTSNTDESNSSVGSTQAVNTCSRCGELCGLSELDPAAFFFSKFPACREPNALPCGGLRVTSSSRCFSPALSLLPRILPRRFARLQQTPAFVRLLTLALLDGVCGSLPPYGTPQSSYEAFLRNTVSAVFRCLATEAIESVSSHVEEIEEAGFPDTNRGLQKPGVASSTEARLPMPNSAKHRRQLRAWQALSCLSCHARSLVIEACEDLEKGVWGVLNCPLMPDVRHYVEFVAVRLARGAPHRCVPQIVETLKRYNASRQVLISALSIGGYILSNIHKWLPKGEEEMLSQTVSMLLEAITPYLTSNAAYCRATAQFLVHRFMSLETVDHQKEVPSSSKTGEHKRINVLPQLFTMLDEAKECRMMAFKVAAAFSRWDPELDGGICSLIPESGILVETTEQHEAALMGLGVVGIAETEETHNRRFADVLSDFDLRPSWALAVALKEAVKDEMKRVWHSEGAAEEFPQLHDRTALLSENAEVKPFEPQAAEAGSPGPCQRKFVPEQYGVVEAPSACLLSGDAAASFSALRQRSDLIVIASLVNKSPNLGGLARTCEVFNVRALVVNSLDLLKDSIFRNISVSAHQWLPMTAVPAATLPGYFNALRAEGYSIVGLEQTASSHVLGEFAFPRKTALVLGAEKEGMPAPLMSHIDHCVEIPQLGLIRSLNVHVSASMCIWEYANQHLL